MELGRQLVEMTDLITRYAQLSEQTASLDKTATRLEPDDLENLIEIKGSQTSHPDRLEVGASLEVLTARIRDTMYAQTSGTGKV